MPNEAWDLGSPIAFRKQFARITKDALAALFLSECFYWSERHEADGGWFYKTAAEWEEETALTRRQQEHARAKLMEMGLLESKRTGKNGVMHYRVVTRVLRKAIRECTDRTNRNVQNAQTDESGSAESYKPECTDRTNRNVRIVQTPYMESSFQQSFQQEERESPARPRPPSLEQFLARAKATGVDPVSAERCWNNYELKGWPNGGSKWDLVLRSWHLGDIQRMQNEAPARNGGGPRARSPEFEPWMLRYGEEEHLTREQLEKVDWGPLLKSGRVKR